MASINLTKLKPGKSYIVKVRAKDADGNYSQYSFSYSFTVPATNLDGTQLVSTNNAVVTALAPSSSSVTGGALIAGGLDTAGAAKAGALNLGSVWNNTASSIAQLTGTASTGAVIINSTGILGYQLTSTSSGQANFFLDTASGNAYFRGTVYANAGQIGGFLINNSNLSASTFFNKLTSFDPSFESNWATYWAASGLYDGQSEYSSSAQFINDTTITPKFGFRYTTLDLSAGAKNSSASISASTMQMVMYKNASTRTAFSQSDLGISTGSTYTLSVYAQDLGTTASSTSLYLQINKYNSASVGTASLIGITSGSPILTSSTSWTRISASFTSNSGEYYTFAIINPYGEVKFSGGGPVSVDSTFAVDAIQLELGNTANSFGFDNYFSVNPSSSQPINLSSIGNTGSTTNIFSVYTDGGVYANYFFSNKQSKIGNIYFGGTGSTNISIGNYYATNNMPDGNNINIGIWSLGVLSSGVNNVMIGNYAGSFLQIGSNNVIIGGYQAEAYWGNGNVVISDGVGNVRIKANSSGLVTIPGSASISGSVYAGTIVGSIASATYAASAIYASSAIYAASATYASNSASLNGLPSASYALSSSSIVIGSTKIPLNSTTASLGGLTNFDLTNNTSSTSIFSISSGVSSTNSPASLGGTIDISSIANSILNGRATGGDINIKSTATETGNSAFTIGGDITMSTSADGSGTLGSSGGDIIIKTLVSGSTSIAGAINITSNGGFTISTALGTGYVGTINNFNIGGTTPGTGNFTSLTISGASVATQAYANSASLNAYNSASAYTAASAHNNTNASVGYAINSGSLGGIISSSYALQSYVNSASLNAYNSASTYTQSSAWNNTSASVKYASSAGFVLGSNVSGIVASATYSSSVGSTIIGGTLDSSSATFNLLSTPNTITAFSAASSITIGYQTNGTSIMNIGSQSYTGTRTLNLFTTLGGSGGQNTINIGASGATLGSTPQVINIGNATGVYNTITIGGSTDTALTLNATASVTGKITAASFVGNGAGLTGITASATGSVTIGSTAIPFNSTASSLLGLSNLTASGTITAASIVGTTASFSGKVTAASFVGNGAGLTGITFSAGSNISAHSLQLDQDGYISIADSGGLIINIGPSGIITAQNFYAQSGDIKIEDGIGSAPASTIIGLGNARITGQFITNNNAVDSIRTSGGVTASSFYGNGSGLTNILVSALSASTITIGSTSIGLGNTSTSLSGLNSISASTISLSSSITAQSASFSGKINAASFVGNGAGLTNIPTSALSASTITIGSTPIGLGNTSTSLSGLSSISASSASISGTINTSSVIATQVTGGGMDLVYSGSFSAASAVNFDNIFNATYTNYKVIVNLTAITGGNLSARLRVGGVSASTSYIGVTWGGVTTAGTTVVASSTASWTLNPSSVFSTNPTTLRMEFFNPFLSVHTHFSNQMWLYNPGVQGAIYFEGANTNSTSYDGFNLTTNSSSITIAGNIRVYGYHN